jgi:MurNAc alpha-1-phosphate uridylyltransferase
MSMVEQPTTAMVLAAGRGERMRPLTDRVPKPLLEVGGRSLIEHHIVKLATAGFKQIIVNHAHLGDQIETALGDGARWGVRVCFSAEHEALETAGGIANALSLIGVDAFAVVNGDVYSDYDYAGLSAATTRLVSDSNWIAHLVLVDNPAHHPRGDFALENGRVCVAATEKLTFSGLAAYRRELFTSIGPGEKKPLAPLLQEQIRVGHVSGEHFTGRWADIGTPERLASLNDLLEREAS